MIDATIFVDLVTYLKKGNKMEHKKWLDYWKKCLADTLYADLEFVKRIKEKKRDVFEIEHFQIDPAYVHDLDKVKALMDEQERRVNEKQRVSDRESKNWKQIDRVDVLIAPIRFKAPTEHLVYFKDPKPITPFWYYATLNREGVLSVPETTFPIFQRKHLSPIADEKTDFIFAELENIDYLSTVGKERTEQYSEYIDYVKEIFRSATKQKIDLYQAEGYETIDTAVVLLPDEEKQAAIGIVELYEKILRSHGDHSLLRELITIENNVNQRPAEVSELINSNSFHLGQMGFEFPLSISQRKSLYTFLNAQSKVFAVNGPPGTGKTTLLQSIVANAVVQSAIAGKEPAVILACSTNNQAVTNIMDSFTKAKTQKGLLEGRWLPGIEGYACYLPASGKEEHELRGLNYKKLDGEGLFRLIENRSYLEDAQKHFIGQSSQYLERPVLRIKDATTALREELVQIQETLQLAGHYWNDYLANEALFLKDYLFEGKATDRYYDGPLLSMPALHKELADLKKLEEKVVEYFRKEPAIRKLFCFLGIRSAKKNRAAELTIILRDSWLESGDRFHFTLSGVLNRINQDISIVHSSIKSLEAWKSWKQTHKIVGDPPRSEEAYWAFERMKIEKKLTANCFYDELDVSLRHKAFQLALHYWEGEYLSQLEIDLMDPKFEKKTEEMMKRRWRRQSMLMPCFVSTFFMAPKFFNSYKFLTKGENGKKLYDEQALFDFIDLLIVDEAGQVSPEVGVATFALAKKAIVVGDVKQIEPVWNINSKIDLGNLRESGLIKNYEDMVYEKKFDSKGFLASSGSIMKMAQNACYFKEENNSEKGVMLLEHRRCYDEIIRYCNELAYENKLIPLKGKAGPDLLFPAMYCIHVEGSSTAANNSRYNVQEVEFIVNWLAKYRQSIEEKYGSIEQAVGIITPFTGQKARLQFALKRAGFNTSSMKIGTVHALQGAERPIVLFSMVYGKGDVGTMFFDRHGKPNMLNVAVSRAEDHFIVFADTAVLNKHAQTPSGLLAKRLTYESEER
ncbi:AAA domain-containing protein [Hydrobacter penzbergensis]|uniref:AAA domain-containing protein n=1 Tax=Hydrobacter penzbergensis TaxID=1235997 RepID=A0A8X8LFA0_9BACT|nr:AAA domain-containing protein [Hydrobacter penzbergensis]SDX01431.1 AAA domain-containing protein [Hydrobacter penzbergensis]